MIQFSKPATSERELEYLAEVRVFGKPWGGGVFYEKATQALALLHPAQEILLTQSCTAALELAAIALEVGPGDEVIVPSYTFVSTANAFALRGASIVFADSEPGTLNIDLDHVEQLLTQRTKAIVVVHYGGVACDMTRAQEIAAKAGVFLVEDAAQAIGSKYGEVPLGTIGDLGCLSFHGTKNISSGEGGALLINTNSAKVAKLARTAHEKGTNRSEFLRGEVDKYTWRSIGGSFIPSEFTCAVLLAQLESIHEIFQTRKTYWDDYFRQIYELPEGSLVPLDQSSPGTNYHMFATICGTEQLREQLRKFLLQKGIQATSHYEPLHESPFAVAKFSQRDEIRIASDLSRRILRLPMWSEEGLDTASVGEAVNGFFQRSINA